MLRDGGFGVGEVAGRVGYESEAAFNRAFRRLTGLSPPTITDSTVRRNRNPATGSVRGPCRVIAEELSFHLYGHSLLQWAPNYKHRRLRNDLARSVHETRSKKAAKSHGKGKGHATGNLCVPGSPHFGASASSAGTRPSYNPEPTDPEPTRPDRRVASAAGDHRATYKAPFDTSWSGRLAYRWLSGTDRYISVDQFRRKYGHELRHDSLQRYGSG